MTARNLYEAVLIEINKENAPNLLLEDFNYYANKTIYQYINKRYNIYDINQQTSDDLRVLKSTAFLKVEDNNRIAKYDDLSTYQDKDAIYSITLPNDYFHILNCICIYQVQKPYKCYDAGDTWRAPATRLTADAYSQVLDNSWFKPTYKRPYYYIHNINTYEVNPTNPYTENGGTDIPKIESKKNLDETESKDANGNPIAEDWGGINTITLRKQTGELKKEYSSVERAAGVRYGNPSEVRLEIRYGTDNSVFKLTNVFIDYLKTPQYIRLTQNQLDRTEDISQTLEFPDYVCQEIVNELVHLIMERNQDGRIQTHPVVSQSIANPAQTQTPQTEG